MGLCARSMEGPIHQHKSLDINTCSKGPKPVCKLMSTSNTVVVLFSNLPANVRALRSLSHTVRDQGLCGSRRVKSPCGLDLAHLGCQRRAQNICFIVTHVQHGVHSMRQLAQRCSACDIGQPHRSWECTGAAHERGRGIVSHRSLDLAAFADMRVLSTA